MTLFQKSKNVHTCMTYFFTCQVNLQKVRVRDEYEYELGKSYLHIPSLGKNYHVTQVKVHKKKGQKL